MTDDTLRAECEVWVSANAPSQYNNTEFAWRVRALEAFARAQQAKARHDDIAIVKEWSTWSGDDVSRLVTMLEAQATAREAETQPPAAL